jgi:AraC family transcriptional regulator
MRDLPETNRAQQYVPAPNVQSIMLNGPGDEPIGVTRLRSDTENAGMTEPHLIEDAFMISIQLRDYRGDIYLRDRKLSFNRQAAGMVLMYDYQREWKANLRSAFDCVNFHIPRSVLDAVVDDQRFGTVETLRFEAGVPEPDHTILGLAQALLPALDLQSESNRLFLDHMGWALGAHVVESYAEIVSLKSSSRGHLAPWQERRAKEMIDANLANEISLSTLAGECGLSTSHFARAFRLTTGVPPYQWLLRRRLDQALELLRDDYLSIAQIASLCGFSDQSHLTRVFTRAIGEPPAAWRRRRAA